MSLLALALQNLGRKPGRAAALALAVAVATAALFAAATLMVGVDRSVATGISRLGADLLVVPRDTLVNIRAALLTGEPSPFYMAWDVLEEVRRVPGVRRAAPQVVLPAAAHALSGGIAHAVVVGFDPESDFTVLPWVTERLGRPMTRHDVIVGGLVPRPPGESLSLYGQALTVWGRLGRTGVGTQDTALFLTLERAWELAEGARHHSHVGPLPRGRGISAVLVQLGVGASPEAVRFAVSRNPGVKAVMAGSPVTSARQTVVGLFGGVVALMGVIFASNVLMVGTIFGAVVNERRRELGLLRAIGARRRVVFRLVLGEALLLTFGGGLGGVALGVLLLRLSDRTLVFALESLNIPFLWPPTAAVLLVAVACLALPVGLGALGAWYPALTVSRREPYDLIRASE